MKSEKDIRKANQLAHDVLNATREYNAAVDKLNAAFDAARDYGVAASWRVQGTTSPNYKTKAMPVIEVTVSLQLGSEPK